MEQNNDKMGFSFSYSAKEQAEIRSIREKYKARSDTTESTLNRLRRLDRSVTSLAQRAALTVGILGILILGFGMSLVMSDLSRMLSLSADTAMLVGIILGICGGAVASLAYPVYTLVQRHRRRRIGPEILRLSDELLK